MGEKRERKDLFSHAYTHIVMGQKQRGKFARDGKLPRARECDRNLNAVELNTIDSLTSAVCRFGPCFVSL